MYRHRDRLFLDYLAGLKHNIMIEKYINKLESENDDRICKWKWDILLEWKLTSQKLCAGKCIEHIEMILP